MNKFNLAYSQLFGPFVSFATLREWKLYFGETGWTIRAVLSECLGTIRLDLTTDLPAAWILCTPIFLL